MERLPNLQYAFSMTLLLGGLTCAQAALPADIEGLEEITVTARKVSENLQRVPVAITALSADAIQERSIHTLSDVQNSAPNLLIKESATEPQSFTLEMRGQE